MLKLKARNDIMSSVEEKVEEYYKTKLDNLGVRHFAKTEEINPSITAALKKAKSKTGGQETTILIFKYY